MVRPAKLAGLLVLNIGGSLKLIVGAPVAALHARDFSLRNSHCRKSSTARVGRGAFVPALIGAISGAGQGGKARVFSLGAGRTRSGPQGLACAARLPSRF